MFTSTMYLQLLLLLQLSWIIQTSSATLLPQSKPGCEVKCGNITIPYPFGIGPSENGCSFTGEEGMRLYNVTCDTSFNLPKPFLSLGLNITSGIYNIFELLSISDAEVRVKTAVATMCYDYKTRNLTLDEGMKFMSTRNTPFKISSTSNKLFGIGCYAMGFVLDKDSEFYTECMSICHTREKIDEGSCSGSGCCQASISKDIKRFINAVDSMNSTTEESLSFNPCSYSFIGESDKYTFSASDLVGTSFLTKGRDIPIVLDWAIGNKTCEEAQTDRNTFACQNNSNCSNSDKISGYLCTCNTGFEGNPYLSPGCQDVNECEGQDNNPCEGICTNTIGSYNCTCPESHFGDGRKGGIGCITKNKEFPILKVTLGIGLGFLFMIVASSLLYLSIRKRQLKKLKEKFFQQNGGLLLKQQISSYEGGVKATKIFTSEELEAATKNYSDKLILGKGGFGTVYLGILSDKSVVAIKKSKVIDESQIEQFINELVILAQVNHRNVVKVLGCCLETEVPLLVYEYVPNGTLFHHIHKKGGVKTSSPLSWKARLRIANESAGAIAYLHSSASIPIIHRDIKSANILLDQNYTARVSDFGGSRLSTLGETQIDTLVQGTLGYLDPEYFLTSQLTDKSDVYSFGVVLVELLTGEKPISFDRPQKQRSLSSFFLDSMERNDVFELIEPQIANGGNYEHVTAIAELARKCLNAEGKHRPTMKQVAAELEILNKLGKPSSEDYNQQSYERKPNMFMDEPRDLYSVAISTYTSDNSGQYSSMESEYSLIKGKQ